LLTARGEDVDRIVGWRSGPTITYRNLLIRGTGCRIRAILRRTRGDKAVSSAPDIVRVGEIELDPATRSVRRDGQPVDLTSVEFNLLEVLLREAGRVVRASVW